MWSLMTRVSLLPLADRSSETEGTQPRLYNKLRFPYWFRCWFLLIAPTIPSPHNVIFDVSTLTNLGGLDAAEFHAKAVEIVGLWGRMLLEEKEAETTLYHYQGAVLPLVEAGSDETCLRRAVGRAEELLVAKTTENDVEVLDRSNLIQVCL